MEQFETRYIAAPLTVADRKISGYAAVFDSKSEDLGGFREIIRPRSFGALVKSDVRALINHDPSMVLGRTTAGTLTLREDLKGLYFEVNLPQTQAANDLMESVRRGDISGSSFAFRVGADGQRWSQDGATKLREITRFSGLQDVSIVTYPAYPDTSIALRSLADFAAGPDWRDDNRKLRQRLAAAR